MVDGKKTMRKQKKRKFETLISLFETKEENKFMTEWKDALGPLS